MSIPTTETIRAELRRLTIKQMEQLADVSGVSFGALMKIRRGDTPNPGIETVAKFLGHIESVIAQAA